MRLFSDEPILHHTEKRLETNDFEAFGFYVRKT